MNQRPHWLDQPKNHRKLWIGFLLVLLATVLVEWVWPIHGHFAIESLTGFNALYGFITCALMIAVAKGLALLLKRPDTYYDDADDNDTMASTRAARAFHGRDEVASTMDADRAHAAGIRELTRGQDD